MTFEEFIEKIQTLNDVCIDDYVPCHFYNIIDSSRYPISVYWSTGGQTGGSCWDEGPHEYHSYSGDPEPEFKALDIILEELCPNIKFLQYKNIYNQVVKTTTVEDGDHYGNMSNYGIKYCYLEELYNKLCEKNLL